MKGQIIEFNTAKLAKEKGVPQDLFNTGWYNRLGRHCGIVNLREDGVEVYCGWDGYQKDTSVKVSKEEYDECCSHVYSAPTQSSLQKHLRETHHIHFHIYYGKDRKWCIDIYSIKDDIEEDYCAGLLNHPNQFINYKTYEEVLEVGLYESLKLI